MFEKGRIVFNVTERLLISSIKYNNRKYEIPIRIKIIGVGSFIYLYNICILCIIAGSPIHIFGRNKPTSHIDPYFFKSNIGLRSSARYFYVSFLCVSCLVGEALFSIIAISLTERQLNFW